MISETTRRAKNRNVTVTLLLQVLCICISKIGEDESPRFLGGNGMPTADWKNAAQEDALAPVLEKFPEAAAKIRQFFRQNPSFQSLCEDYRDCLAAWELWRRAAPGEVQAVCQSYAELLRELEEEVRQYLEHEEVSGSSR